MALTGLDIYKLLPKTNCKKCGFLTCLAFAMALASKKISLDKCPDVSEQAKLALESASEPPIRTISIGRQDNKFEIGGETVLFRHEKTFYHPTGLGIFINDNISDSEISSKIDEFNKLIFDRVGKKVTAEFITVNNISKDKTKFLGLIQNIKTKSPQALLILLSEDLSILEDGIKIVLDTKPIIGSANKNNYEQFVNLAKKYNVPLIIKEENLDEISSTSQKILSSGYKDIILDVSDNNPNIILENLTQVRRLALIKNFRPLGFPTIVFLNSQDEFKNIALASTFIAKYSSIVILPNPNNWEFLTLVTLRLNIYTDPQKPVSVESKLYSIGGQPTDKSPVLVTTNFSLTYYTVVPEIINSKIPSWLLVVDADGLSVLTAWAAEKFTAEKVVDAMKKFNIENAVNHKKLIIPGYVAVMSGKLNELSGWDVLVGPREASGIPKYLKTIWQ